MENIKVKVQDFKEEDWKFEISSGYSGYRNINPDSLLFNEWVYSTQIEEMRNSFNDYQRDLALLLDFREKSLDLQQCQEKIILEFLDEKYNK